MSPVSPILLYTQVVDIMGDMTIDVMLLQDKTPPTNLFVDDRSLESILELTAHCRADYSTETWASGNFTANQWVVAGANWQMATGLVTLLLRPMFYCSPTQNDYSPDLTSKNLTGVHAPQCTEV